MLEQEFQKLNARRLTCPECKNELDLKEKGELKKEDVIECEHCGMTLELTGEEGDKLTAEITDEGK